MAKPISLCGLLRVSHPNFNPVLPFASVHLDTISKSLKSKGGSVFWNGEAIWDGVWDLKFGRAIWEGDLDLTITR